MFVLYKKGDNQRLLGQNTVKKKETKKDEGTGDEQMNLKINC